QPAGGLPQGEGHAAGGAGGMGGLEGGAADVQAEHLPCHDEGSGARPGGILAARGGPVNEPARRRPAPAWGAGPAGPAPGGGRAGAGGGGAVSGPGGGAATTGAGAAGGGAAVGETRWRLIWSRTRALTASSPEKPTRTPTRVTAPSAGMGLGTTSRKMRTVL